MELMEILNQEPYLFLSDAVKKISNRDRLKKELADTIDDLKITKLKEYNIL
jgi:uncharacterized protein YihD (DUF1040 family)